MANPIPATLQNILESRLVYPNTLDRDSIAIVNPIRINHS